MKLLSIALIGMFGGLTSGLFGVGGGLVFVPLLMFLGFDAHRAVATSLAVILPTTLIAVIRHSRAGMMDWTTAALIAVFAIVGAWFGSTLSIQMDTVLLRRLFAGFLVIVAAKIFFSH